MGGFPLGRRGGRRWGTGVATVEVANDLARVEEVGATEPVAGELGVEEGTDEAVGELPDIEAGEVGCSRKEAGVGVAGEGEDEGGNGEEVEGVLALDSRGGECGRGRDDAGDGGGPTLRGTKGYGATRCVWKRGEA